MNKTRADKIVAWLREKAEKGFVFIDGLGRECRFSSDDCGDFVFVYGFEEDEYYLIFARDIEDCQIHGNTIVFCNTTDISVVKRVDKPVKIPDFK